MARLDPRPPLVPKMVRLAPEDWDRMERYAAGRGSTASVVIRAVIHDFLDWVEETAGRVPYVPDEIELPERNVE